MIRCSYIAIASQALYCCSADYNNKYWLSCSDIQEGLGRLWLGNGVLKEFFRSLKDFNNSLLDCFQNNLAYNVWTDTYHRGKYFRGNSCREMNLFCPGIACIETSGHYFILFFHFRAKVEMTCLAILIHPGIMAPLQGMKNAERGIMKEAKLFNKGGNNWPNSKWS